MFRRILVATDGSAVGEAAVREAVQLAAEQHAELTVLTVLCFYDAVSRMQMATETLFERYLQRLRHEDHVILDHAMTQAAAAGVPAHALLREAKVDRAAEAIVAEARQGYDLIVIGTHGRRGFDRLVMGSDAEEVARRAPVPVLLVRGAAE